MEDIPIYNVTFENYLHPKQTQKFRKLLLPPEKLPDVQQKNNKNNTTHLVNVKRTKWQRFRKMLKQKFLRKSKKSSHKVLKSNTRTFLAKTVQAWIKNSSVEQEVPKRQTSFFAFNCCSELPICLSFLRARNDDGLCKRKTGFEIYCEMASIHGFVNFVGAKTWQRMFWCMVIVFAILLSVIVLVMSHFLSQDTPTIVRTESTQYLVSLLPFPAVTICNMNRISRSKSEEVAAKLLLNTDSWLTYTELLELLRSTSDAQYIKENMEIPIALLKHLLDQHNWTLSRLQQEISVTCEEQLLRCKWQNEFIDCKQIFEIVTTSQGNCCSFNYLGAKKTKSFRKQSPHHPTGCGYETGLTVLLNPQIDDYFAALAKVPGFQVFIHDALDYPSESMEPHFVWSRTETVIEIRAQTVHASKYLRSENLQNRRCFFPNERKLQMFANYSQNNCLYECRCRILAEKCGCLPAYLPRFTNITPVCNMEQLQGCVQVNMIVFQKILLESQYNEPGEQQHYLCNCYPACSYNIYQTQMDYVTLDATYAYGSRSFFQNIHLINQSLLHIYYEDLYATAYSWDVYENWLSFVGTFGGITGLHMGYSFVSGFEMIFFTLVRPLCNWLTRKQIIYKIKRRREKLAAAKKALEEIEKKELEKQKAAAAAEEEEKEKAEAQITSNEKKPEDNVAAAVTEET